MGKDNIAFKNLRAEMARHNVTIGDMAAYLGVTHNTMGDKLSRKRQINLDEAFRISKRFFPELTIYYLFAELIPNTKEGA